MHKQKGKKENHLEWTDLAGPPREKCTSDEQFSEWAYD